MIDLGIVAQAPAYDSGRKKSGKEVGCISLESIEVVARRVLSLLRR